ncbi:MAG TPA: hypothetical protein VI564_09000 [Candidatus Nanoarchaeia archaeon]|nr:hypothetical protein [Candidatus Nanoarchaeia archaeon]
MEKRIKIEVYLNKKDKIEIQKRADKLDISASDYLKLKALDRLKEK